MKKKVISFSLWGNIKLYTIGMVKNAILAKKIFPDWIVYVYYDNTVPNIIINYLNKMDNVELKFIDKPSGSKKWKECGQFGMFWKFYPFDDNEVDIWMARDVDSRISLYEKKKIDDFLKSDKIIHAFLFNDKKKLRGGTTSFKNYLSNKDTRKNLKIYKLIDEFVKDKENTPFYTDERFLNNILYHIFSNKYCWDNQCHNINKLKQMKVVINSPNCHKYNIDYVGRVVDEYDISCDKGNNNNWYRYNYEDFNDIINKFKIKNNLIIISYTSHGDYHSYIGIFRFLLRYYNIIHIVINQNTPLFILKDLLKDKINRFKFCNIDEIIKLNLNVKYTNMLNLSISKCKHGRWNTNKIFNKPIEFYMNKGIKYYNDNTFAKNLNIKEESDFSGYEMTDIGNTIFYKNIGLNPNLVFKYYYYERNKAIEDKIYKHILLKHNIQSNNPLYNIICQYNTTKNNYIVNKKYINNNYININIHKICDNPITLLKLFENASEIHLMENSIALLLYYLQKSNIFKIQNKINIHLYMRKRNIECINMLRNPILENWNFIE